MITKKERDERMNKNYDSNTSFFRDNDEKLLLTINDDRNAELNKHSVIFDIIKLTVTLAWFNMMH